MDESRPSFVMVRVQISQDPDDGTFRPDENGQWAVTLAVNNRNGRCVDFCAFFINDPGKWWLRRRTETPVLGADRIDYAAFYQQTLNLHPTPSNWLLARGDGAVVLDWGCDLRGIFEGVPQIACQSAALKKRLRRSFAKFQPTIIAPKWGHRAA